jgi:hypothetical protein
MLKKYCLIFLIGCFIFINSVQSFAIVETGKLNIKVDLNGNGNLISNDSFEVNYYNEEMYNILLNEFAQGATKDEVPIGKYKLDYIDFVSAKRLHLELKAPKNFEIKKGETTEINFELVKKDYTASSDTPTSWEAQKQETLTPEPTVQSTQKADLNGAKNNKNTPTDKPVKKNKKVTQKKYHVDYLTIVLLIALVIALVIIKKKSNIKVD